MIKNSKNKLCFIQYNLGATSETFLTRHIELLKSDFDIYCITGKVWNSNILSPEYVFNYTEQSTLCKFTNALKKKIRRTSFDYSNNILRFLRQIKPDLIVFQFAFLPVLLEKELKKINQPYIVIHHGTDINRAVEDKIYHRKLKKVWQYATKAIFISEFLQKKANELKCPMDKSINIPLGVPLNCKDSLAESTDTECFSILSVGRLVPVKNHSFLIKAFSIFCLTHPNSQLYIIGDGPEKERLNALIKKHKLNDKVTLLGNMPFEQVKKHIAQCDVCCLVSKKIVNKGVLQEEGLGLTLLEAASFKKPLIGTNSGGIPEIVINNKTGILVEVDDINELSNGFEYLSKNSNERIRMGENAFNHAIENYGQTKQIIQYKKLYNKIIINN